MRICWNGFSISNEPVINYLCEWEGPEEGQGQVKPNSCSTKTSFADQVVCPFITFSAYPICWPRIHSPLTEPNEGHMVCSVRMYVSSQRKLLHTLRCPLYPKRVKLTLDSRPGHCRVDRAQYSKKHEMVRTVASWMDLRSRVKGKSGSYNQMSMWVFIIVKRKITAKESSLAT